MQRVGHRGPKTLVKVQFFHQPRHLILQRLREDTFVPSLLCQMLSDLGVFAIWPNHLLVKEGSEVSQGISQTNRGERRVSKGGGLRNTQA